MVAGGSLTALSSFDFWLKLGSGLQQMYDSNPGSITIGRTTLITGAPQIGNGQYLLITKFTSNLREPLVTG